MRKGIRDMQRERRKGVLLGVRLDAIDLRQQNANLVITYSSSVILIECQCWLATKTLLVMSTGLVKAQNLRPSTDLFWDAPMMLKSKVINFSHSTYACLGTLSITTRGSISLYGPLRGLESSFSSTSFRTTSAIHDWQSLISTRRG